MKIAFRFLEAETLQEPKQEYEHEGCTGEDYWFLDYETEVEAMEALQESEYFTEEWGDLILVRVFIK